jgi:hypothetical protein
MSSRSSGSGKSGEAVERCLACEAVVSGVIRRDTRPFFVHAL